MGNHKSTARFGPGGNSLAFYNAGFKATVDAPAWLAGIGLDAYEFEASRGVNTGSDTLYKIGKAANENGIRVSLHAPYYISLSGIDPEKRLKSVDYIRDSLDAAEKLGAYIIVVHTGSTAKLSRADALRLAADTIAVTLENVADNGVFIGLETMGKQNQLGTLDEVLSLCRMSPRLAPVVDFGHLNARALGGQFPDTDAYKRVFDQIGTALGDAAARRLHCHFSKIQWTASGEKKHLTFDDVTFGPAFEPLMDCLVQENLAPTIICESAGTMSDDALTMKHYYERIH